MSLPDQTPKLPKIPFLVGDAVLLVAAWYIAEHGGSPLSANTIAAVTACVAAGALLGVIPFLSDYARKQDEALDERQRGLEALSRTINTAAEQISIAANGLNELTELTHKNLKHAEQLPHKLQDKIAEFNAQLDNARDDDREELEKEVAELRATETERLQSIADKVHKAVAELTTLDATAQKHLNARTQLVERASDTIVKAQTDTAVALANVVGSVTRELAAAQARALAEIDTKLAERTAQAVAAIASAPLPSFPAPVAASPAVVADNSEAAPPLADTAESAATPEVAAPPRRPRKSRREEPAATEAASAPEPSSPEPQPAAEAVPAAPTIATGTTPVADVAAESPISEAAVSVVDEPVPVPAESIPQIEPVAPPSADPFVEPSAAATPEVEPAASSDSVQSAPAVEPATPPPASEPSAEAEAAVTAPAATESEAPAIEEPPVERPTKRRNRKAAPEEGSEALLDPVKDELFAAASDDSQVNADPDERVISSDGATRLIATAYIGIGNRLFIRGEGPGLSWEKGVPLQFVSIGKWRWETADAAAPIPFRLYKNDDVECAGLGLRTLEPGHQQEVTAKF